MSKSRLLLAPLAALAVALLVACGGDKKDDSASTSEPGASSSSSSSGSGGGSSTQLDLARSTAKIQDLRSFRFDVSLKMDLGSPASGPSSGSSSDDALGDAFASILLGALGDIKATGAFVKPDQMEVTLKLGGQDISMVQIKDKAWVKFGGKWQVTDPDDDIGLGSPSDLLGDLLPAEVLKGARTSSETVNGVKTTKYSFDKKALEALTKELGEGADFKDISTANLDVWLNGDSIPVKLVMNIGGKDEKGKNVSVKMEMNITDINSDIKIKAPI